MKYKGIPFIWQVFGEREEHGTSSGIYPSIIVNCHNGNFKGINLSGFVNYLCGDSSGFNLTGLLNVNEGKTSCNKGVNIAGLVNNLENSKGVNIAGGVNYNKGNSKGVNIAGGVNYNKGRSEGINSSGVGNYSSKVYDFLIQYGTIGNIVKECSRRAFILQIGLFNRIEDQYCPIVNIKGLKNLLKQIKKILPKRNKNNLERIVE